MSVDEKVRRHFDKDAPRFDAIYEDHKGPFAKFVDGVWRGVVRRRLEVALKELAPFEGRTVLDVGCGSGRFCVEFAKAGAKRVVGIDFAGEMIVTARRITQDAGLADRCEYIVGGFPEALPAGSYDLSVAIGFFDYVKDAAGIVAAMRERTSGRMLLSFPKAWEWRVPIRRMRFVMAGCPLFLYTRGAVQKVLDQAGCRKARWIELDRDYLVLIDLA